jgi:hypothetical protein
MSDMEPLIEVMELRNSTCSGRLCAACSTIRIAVGVAGCRITSTSEMSPSSKPELFLPSRRGSRTCCVAGCVCWEGSTSIVEYSAHVKIARVWFGSGFSTKGDERRGRSIVGRSGSEGGSLVEVEVRENGERKVEGSRWRVPEGLYRQRGARWWGFVSVSLRSSARDVRPCGGW